MVGIYIYISQTERKNVYTLSVRKPEKLISRVNNQTMPIMCIMLGRRVKEGIINPCAEE